MFGTVLLKAHDLSFWILTECNLSWKKLWDTESFRGLNDKYSASQYFFTSDLMYKRYERLVYSPPDLLARFCKVNLSNAKNSAWFVVQEFVTRPNLLWSRAIMALECDRRWLLFFFFGVHIRLSTRCKMFCSKIT